MPRSGERGLATRVAAAFAVCALATATTPARAGRAAHARVELLSESSSAPPGASTNLGVRFTIDEGWHIYWRNPGESGGAPAVAWTTPPELSVGDLDWPTPTRFAATGDTTYGYQGVVVLLAAAHGAEPGASIRARVDYQICKDVCVKETARLNTTLPLGQEAPSPNADVFANARASLPVPMPAAWTAYTSAEPQEWLLVIDTGRTESAGMFFPYQADLLDDSAAQRVETRPTGLSLHLKKSRTSSPSAPPPTLDGLLVRPGERAVEIRAGIR